MDQITKGLLDGFIETHELNVSGSNESVNFEHFVNHSVISNVYSSPFNFENVSAGETQGVDGIGIIVNGNLIYSVEEIDNLIEANGYLDVDYIFIQSKTTSSFNVADIGHFFDTVKDFFSDNPLNNQTVEIRSAIELNKKIFDNTSRMKRRNPNCKLYYVTTGNWANDRSLEAKIETGKSELDSLNLFESIDFYPCGAKEIQQFYRKTQNASECTFIFDKKVPLPVDDPIRDAYSGVVKFDEFLKIITDDNGEIKSIFYDNVRDFLGPNIQINAGIEESLQAEESNIFCLLNNGVTIVAESATIVRNSVSLLNYQIVNGCQTCHVLHRNKDLDDLRNAYIPVKLLLLTMKMLKIK